MHWNCATRSKAMLWTTVALVGSDPMPWEQKWANHGKLLRVSESEFLSNLSKLSKLNKCLLLWPWRLQAECRATGHSPRGETLVRTASSNVGRTLFFLASQQVQAQQLHDQLPIPLLPITSYDLWFFSQRLQNSNLSDALQAQAAGYPSFASCPVGRLRQVWQVAFYGMSTDPFQTHSAAIWCCERGRLSSPECKTTTDYGYRLVAFVTWGAKQMKPV